MKVIRDHLITNETLTSPNYLLKNDRWYLVMQDDGNLVIYDGPVREHKHSVWRTRTNGKGVGPYRLNMLSDGDIVLTDAYSSVLWNSGTSNCGTQPFRLQLNESGQLELKDSRNILAWVSHQPEKEWTDTLSSVTSSLVSGLLSGIASTTVTTHVPGPRYVVRTPVSTTVVSSPGVVVSTPLFAPPPPPPVTVVAPTIVPPVIVSAPCSCSSRGHSLGCCNYVRPHPQHGKYYLRLNGEMGVNEQLFSQSCNALQYGVYNLVLQDDGNLVLYKGLVWKPRFAIWSSKTNGRGVGPYRFIVQADCNLVLYDAYNNALWASHTNNRAIPKVFKISTHGGLGLIDCYDKMIWTSHYGIH